MEITKTQRQLAEERASETQQRLYGDPESGEALWKMAERFKLTDRKLYYQFTQMVGDVVLGFYKTSDMAALIYHGFPSLSPEGQAALTKEVEGFLLPLQEEVLPAAYATPTIEHESVAYKATPVSESLNADPVVEKQHATAATPGIRTMARDIETISSHDYVVHTAASQADILQKSPVEEVRTGPRWDSE